MRKRWLNTQGGRGRRERDGETKRARRGTCKIRKEMHRRRDRRGKEESDRVRGMEVNM